MDEEQLTSRHDNTNTVKECVSPIENGIISHSRKADINDLYDVSKAAVKITQALSKSPFELMPKLDILVANAGICLPPRQNKNSSFFAYGKVLQISGSYHMATDGHDLRKPPTANIPRDATFLYRDQRSHSNSKHAQIRRERTIYN